MHVHMYAHTHTHTSPEGERVQSYSKPACTLSYRKLQYVDAEKTASKTLKTWPSYI